MKILYVLLMFFLVSCATGHIATTSLSEEELLSNRVKLFWEAKKKRDWEVVKDFVDPDLREKVFPYLDSLKTSPSMAEMISYDVREIKLEPSKATVLTGVKWNIVHPLLGGSPLINESEIRDVWIKKRGIWYVIIERPDISDIMNRLGKKRKGGDN